MLNLNTDFPGLTCRPLKNHADSRGWLIELFRDDELPEGFEPAMGYVSVTHSGVARGPHEHRDQTDGFGFVNGQFDLYLWENREGFGEKSVVIRVGIDNPVFITVPPGIVHAYKNVGDTDAYVLNYPNRLYAGWGRAEAVDEIRHEDSSESRFRL